MRLWSRISVSVARINFIYYSISELSEYSLALRLSETEKLPFHVPSEKCVGSVSSDRSHSHRGGMTYEAASAKMAEKETKIFLQVQRPAKGDRFVSIFIIASLFRNLDLLLLSGWLGLMQ